MKNFCPHAQGFAKRFSACGHDHEFLEIDRRIGVRATVHDIHHRHGENLGIGSAEIFIEWQTAGSRGRVRRCHRDAEDSVGAQFGFGGGSIKGEHGAIDPDLISGVHAS